MNDVTTGGSLQAAGPSLPLDVLIADDQVAFTRTLNRWFQIEAPGWTLEAVHDADGALEAILAARHDVVLLDWHLGEGPTGVDVCRRARERGSTVPIVMLTVKDSVSERLEALRAGADEHFVKGSISPRELCTRLSVTYFRDRERRASIPPASGSVNAIGPLTIHLRERTVFLGGELIPLSLRQRSLLVRLARAMGHVVPHGELCAASGLATNGGFEQLHEEMFDLRQRLGPEAAEHVQPVGFSGYRLQ